MYAVINQHGLRNDEVARFSHQQDAILDMKARQNAFGQKHVVAYTTVEAPERLCDFCRATYRVIDRFDDWDNACVSCAAEGQAQLELDEARYPTVDRSGPETYTYSPNR